jgi:membrane-associated phospholipid phosphatase
MERAMDPLNATRAGLLKAWVVTLLAASCIVFYLPVFFSTIAVRPGILLYDPLLDRLPARDVSVALFVFLYAVVLFAVLALARHPLLFLRTAQAYVMLLGLRLVTMALVPLEPPPGLVPLQDPISTLFYPGREPFGKDLFFSGHTATVFLLYLAFPKGPGRRAMLVATVLVGVSVLVQHVHWTIDVLAAPFFAALAWWLSGPVAAWSRGGRWRRVAE